MFNFYVVGGVIKEDTYLDVFFLCKEIVVDGNVSIKIRSTAKCKVNWYVNIITTLEMDTDWRIILYKAQLQAAIAAIKCEQLTSWILIDTT